MSRSTRDVSPFSSPGWYGLVAIEIVGNRPDRTARRRHGHTQTRHLTAKQLAERLGVIQTTMANKAGLINRTLDIGIFEPDLTRVAMLRRGAAGRIRVGAEEAPRRGERATIAGVAVQAVTSDCGPDARTGLLARVRPTAPGITLSGSGGRADRLQQPDDDGAVHDVSETGQVAVRDAVPAERRGIGVFVELGAPAGAGPTPTEHKDHLAWPPVTRRLLPLVLALLTLTLAACGSDEESGGESAATPAPTETPAPASDNRDLTVKPTIAKPDGEPPARLAKDDIVPGKGRAAKSGDQVTVQYVGVSYSTGEQFDASWDSGQPFPFRLGAGEVIPGWDEGIPGMRVGGRRQLTIPPEKGYGAEGTPDGAIAPNETLIFVVDVVDIQPG